MSNILKTIGTLTEENKVRVRVKTTKTADGSDLYKTYSWFKDMFPDPNNITGVIWGKPIISGEGKGEVYVNFVAFDGDKVDATGHNGLFNLDDIEEI